MSENFEHDYLLEDTVVQKFCDYLTARNWDITSSCLGRNHGTDIVAKKENLILLVEAKGARGNPKNGPTKRDKFDSGQIKDHLGKAIVKVLELKAENRNALLIVAHPFTKDIFEIVKPVAEELLPLGICFCFLKGDGDFIFINPLNLG